MHSLRPLVEPCFRSLRALSISSSEHDGENEADAEVELAGVAPAKRGPGRPRKNVPRTGLGLRLESKRGRGRPKKQPAPPPTPAPPAGSESLRCLDLGCATSGLQGSQSVGQIRSTSANRLWSEALFGDVIFRVRVLPKVESSFLLGRLRRWTGAAEGDRLLQMARWHSHVHSPVPRLTAEGLRSAMVPVRWCDRRLVPGRAWDLEGFARRFGGLHEL